MKVLLVGAGAVGQVLGLFLQKAGVELALYDRPAVAEKLNYALAHEGLPLFQLSGSQKNLPEPHVLEKYEVCAWLSECLRFQPKQIWFATPSQVYHSDWFRDLLAAFPAARIVCFAPEGARPDIVPEGDRERLVFGGIAFMAWQGDLDGGGGRPEAVNFWLPPGISIPLAGTEKACGEVAVLLQKAGLKVSLVKADSPMQAAVTAVMTTFVVGLELSGWSLRAFRQSTRLEQAARAAHQAALGQFPWANLLTRVTLWAVCNRPFFSLACLLLPRLVPFDLEKYLRFHYTKTREQTLLLLELFAKDCECRDLPAEDIRALQKGLTA